MPKGNVVRERVLLVACAALATLLVTWIAHAQEQPKTPEVLEILRVRHFTIVDEEGLDVATLSATGRELTITPVWEGNNGGQITLDLEFTGIKLERPPSAEDAPIRFPGRRTIIYPRGIAVSRLEKGKVFRGAMLADDVLRFAGGPNLRYGPAALELDANNGEGGHHPS